MFKQSFKKFRRKGQTLVLYAFLVPLLFTVGAAAVDWGLVLYKRRPTSKRG